MNDYINKLLVAQNVVKELVLKDFENLINGAESAFWKYVDHKNDLINEKFHLNN